MAYKGVAHRKRATRNDLSRAPPSPTLVRGRQTQTAFSRTPISPPAAQHRQSKWGWGTTVLHAPCRTGRRRASNSQLPRSIARPTGITNNTGRPRRRASVCARLTNEARGDHSVRSTKRSSPGGRQACRFNIHPTRAKRGPRDLFLPPPGDSPQETKVSELDA